MRSLTAAVAAALVLLPAAPAWAAPNQAPVTVADTATYRNNGGQDYRVDALANDSDPDGDVLSYTAVGPATKGNAFLRGGQLFYKPYLGNTGTDSFTYTVTDGQGNSATGTVTATLWVDPPQVADVAITPAPGTAALSWPPVQHAVQYRVYRQGVLAHTTSGTSWTDTGIPDDVARHYTVAGVNGGGFEGLQSSSVSRWPRPSAPTALAVAVTPDPTALLVTWAGQGFLGPWRLYRDGVQVATTTAAQFRDTGLVTGRAYRYQVQLVGQLDSPLSATVVGAPAGLTAIGELFRDLGWSDGTLGEVTVPERAIYGGRRQDHRNGIILQPTGGAPVTVRSSFVSAWESTGGVAGLGYPLDEWDCTLRDDGCGQLFERGSIWYSPFGPPAVVVPADVEEGWAANGWEEGPLGYPLARGIVLPSGGVTQEFDGGAVYWSQGTGAHGVAWPIRARWQAAGAEGGRLGYPTSEQVCGQVGGGCVQLFQGGSIYWSPSTGGQIVLGAIREVWGQNWSQLGPLGYPTTSENCTLRGSGCNQLFQGGAIYWSPATGAHVVIGSIRTTWHNSWSQDGKLGYPTTSENCGLRGGGCFQLFQGGSIYWSPATGAHVVLGAIRDTWARQGWETGRLGYPLTGENCGLRGGGCFQLFQGGSVYWSPATGAHVVLGGIRDVWAGQGWETGRLGYPVGSESFSGGTYRQTFQGGTISLGAGGTRIAYR